MSIGAAGWRGKAIFGLSLVGLGCGPATEAMELESGFTTGPTPEDEEPLVETSTTGAEMPAGSSSGDDDPMIPPVEFDVGVVPDLGDVPTVQGCTKIDFLFVIDDSSSMETQQQHLLDSVPGFIEAIDHTIETVDSVHVGVITSDAYVGNAPGCHALGDLVTKTWGPDASNTTCGPFAEGHRFATEADDLAHAFPCMAKVGTGGSVLERPVTASIKALDPEHNAVGGCNEGFLRDDAVLVIVIVSDDPPFDPDHDDAHPDTPHAGWYQAIVDAKGGDPEAVVVLAFVPVLPLGCTFAENTNVIDFVERFEERGVVANVCDADFAAVFADTVATIDTTCGEFRPQG